MLTYFRDITQLSSFQNDFTDTITCTFDDEKQNSRELLVVSIIIMLSIYALLSAILLYNLYNYLIKQERYKTFHIIFFYFLSFAVIILRVAFFSLTLRFLYQVKDKAVDPPVATDNIDNFATYFELILGMQQLCSMVELNLMIKFSSLYKVFNRNDGDLVKKK